MRPLSPVRRALIAVLAAFQVAVPAFVVIADAQLARASAGAIGAHVEDHTGRNCRPAHPDDCALCRLVSHNTPLRVAAPGVPVSSPHHAGASSDVARLVSSIERALQRSRAPPVG